MTDLSVPGLPHPLQRLLEQQHGSRCRMWVTPEIKDPILLHAPTHKSIACFEAVNRRTEKFVRRMCRVCLMPQPSKTSWLNCGAIKRVWKLTRRLATHNRYFATLANVLQAVNACFDRSAAGGLA